MEELLLSLRDERPQSPHPRALLLADGHTAQALQYQFLHAKSRATPNLVAYFSSPARLTFGSAAPPKPHLFPKQELLGFSIHTTTGRWTR